MEPEKTQLPPEITPDLTTTPQLLKLAKDQLERLPDLLVGVLDHLASGLAEETGRQALAIDAAFHLAQATGC